MGTQRSLHDILNDVSSRLDAAERTPVVTSKSTITELEAFRACDELLADLHKQYADARENRARSEKEFGQGDGMTDMAAILEDSAWCAMQTRYMELRANRSLMKRVQGMIEEARIAAEEAKKIEDDKKALLFYRQIQMMMKMREQRRESEAMFFLFLVSCATQNGVMFRAQTSYDFNRLAA